MRMILRFNGLLKGRGVAALFGAALWLNLSRAIAHDAEAEISSAIAKLAHIKVGDADTVIAKKIEPMWFRLATNEFLQNNPYNIAVPYTNAASITEWRSKNDTCDGQPVIL